MLLMLCSPLPCQSVAAACNFLLLFSLILPQQQHSNCVTHIFAMTTFLSLLAACCMLPCDITFSCSTAATGGFCAWLSASLLNHKPSCCVHEFRCCVAVGYFLSDASRLCRCVFMKSSWCICVKQLKNILCNLLLTLWQCGITTASSSSKGNIVIMKIIYKFVQQLQQHTHACFLISAFFASCGMSLTLNSKWKVTFKQQWGNKAMQHILSWKCNLYGLQVNCL